MAASDRVLTGDPVAGTLSSGTKGLLDAFYSPAGLPVDPAAYGALANGTTDDTNAIKSALSAAGAGGTVRLRAGKTYIVSSLMTLPSAATLDGTGATIKVANSANAFNVLTVGSGGGNIFGLTIDLNKANTIDSGSPLVGVGIFVSSNGWASLRVQDVRIVNGYQYGLYLTNFNGLSDAALAAEHRTRIVNVIVDACGYGMGFGKFGGLVMEGCAVTNSTAGTGVYFSLMRDPQVIGNKSLGNAGSGLFFDYVFQGLVANNQCHGNTGSGIVFGGGVAANGSSREFVASGNACRSNNECGITCDPTKSGSPNVWQRQDGVLVGNVVESNGRAGIQLENSGYMTLTGNVSRLSGRINTATGYGIRATGAYFAVSGNVCTGNSAQGIGLLGSSATPDTGHHRVGSNVVAGNTGGTYFIGDSVVDMKFSTTQGTAPE